MGGKLDLQQPVDQSTDQMDVPRKVSIWKNYHKVFEKKSGNSFRETKRNLAYSLQGVLKGANDYDLLFTSVYYIFFLFPRLDFIDPFCLNLRVNTHELPKLRFDFILRNSPLRGSV